MENTKNEYIKLDKISKDSEYKYKFKNFSANNNRLGSYVDKKELAKIKNEDLILAFHRSGFPGRKMKSDKSKIPDDERYKFKQFYNIEYYITMWYGIFRDLWSPENEDLVKSTISYYNSLIGHLHSRGSAENIVLALIVIYTRTLPRGFYRRKFCPIDKRFVTVVKKNLECTFKNMDYPTLDELEFKEEVYDDYNEYLKDCTTPKPDDKPYYTVKESTNPEFDELVMGNYQINDKDDFRYSFFNWYKDKCLK